MATCVPLAFCSPTKPPDSEHGKQPQEETCCSKPISGKLAGMLSRVGRWCFHKRRTVLGLWILGLAALLGAAIGIGGGFTAEQQLPGSETEAGFDALDEHFGAFGGAGSGLTGSIVFSAEQGVHDPEVVAVMRQMFAAANALDGATILSPYDSGRSSGGGISDDEMIAYADIQLGKSVDQESSGAIGEQIGELIPTLEGLQVEIGGSALSGFEPPQSELIGVAFAIFILILATGYRFWAWDSPSGWRCSVWEAV